MKVVIASDIHGSAFYCAKLLEAYRVEKAEKLILLGDVLYHGPRNDLPEGYNPKAVIEMLNNMSEEILCVRGNCDAEVDQMVLRFPIMDEYKKIDSNIFINHGHHLDEGIVPVSIGDVVFYGHTHIPAFESKDGVVYINPGSVSIPKNGSDHSYILLDGKNVYFKNLDGTTWEHKNI